MAFAVQAEFHEARIHARTHHSFEDLAQDIAVAKAAVTIDRKCRMIRNLVVEIETAEPAIRKVKCDLLTKPPLKTHTVAVAHDQHPDHELRVDRGSPNVAVERSQLLVQVREHSRHDRIDPTQQMARWNTAFEIEQIEQLALIARLPTHHGKPPPLKPSSRRNHCSPKIASPFSTLSFKTRRPPQRSCVCFLQVQTLVRETDALAKTPLRYADTTQQTAWVHLGSHLTRSARRTC